MNINEATTLCVMVSWFIPHLCCKVVNRIYPSICYKKNWRTRGRREPQVWMITKKKYCVRAKWGNEWEIFMWDPDRKKRNLEHVGEWGYCSFEFGQWEYRDRIFNFGIIWKLLKGYSHKIFQTKNPYICLQVKNHIESWDAESRNQLWGETKIAKKYVSGTI